MRASWNLWKHNSQVPLKVTNSFLFPSCITSNSAQRYIILLSTTKILNQCKTGIRITFFYKLIIQSIVIYFNIWEVLEYIYVYLFWIHFAVLFTTSFYVYLTKWCKCSGWEEPSCQGHSLSEVSMSVAKIYKEESNFLNVLKKYSLNFNPLPLWTSATSSTLERRAPHPAIIDRRMPVGVKLLHGALHL